MMAPLSSQGIASCGLVFRDCGLQWPTPVFKAGEVHVLFTASNGIFKLRLLTSMHSANIMERALSSWQYNQSGSDWQSDSMADHSHGGFTPCDITTHSHCGKVSDWFESDWNHRKKTLETFILPANQTMQTDHLKINTNTLI